MVHANIVPFVLSEYNYTFTEQREVTCTEPYYNSQSIEDAKNLCIQDYMCVGVDDWGCDGKGELQLCREIAEVRVLGHCIHKKGL